MERIGNSLEKFRVKIHQMGDMKSSLTEMIKILPELQEVSMHILEKFYIEVSEAYDSRLICNQCENKDVKYGDCRKTIAIFEDGGIKRYSQLCIKQQRRMALKHIDDVMQQSRVGKRFQNRRIDTFEITPDNKKAYEKCMSYIQKFKVEDGNGLLLVGGYGTGKTHLAVGIMKELMKKDICGVFVTVPELLQKIRNNFDSQNTEASKVIDIMKTAELLVLDDLGAEKVTEWTQEQLFIIINARYENMLSTIVTSNCGIVALKQQIGERTVSRLIEMCDGVSCNGADYRERKLGAS